MWRDGSIPLPVLAAARPAQSVPPVIDAVCLGPVDGVAADALAPVCTQADPGYARSIALRGPRHPAGAARPAIA